MNNCSEHTEYEVTLLLNCLLALVTLPIEKNKIQRNQTQNSKVIKFQQDCINKIKELKNSNEKFDINNNEKLFFNNIRNAIAHLHIELEESVYKGKIENVILRNAINETNFKNEKYTLQINISVSNLKIFSKYVATEYLKNFF